MNKMIGGLAFLAAPFLTPGAVASSTLELTLSSEFVGFEYRALDQQRGSEWGLAAMHNSDVNASLASLMFNVVGAPREGGDLIAGLGLKALVHDTFQTAASLAPGGWVRYEPEAFHGLGFEGQIYFAPEMLNTNDAEQYRELIARITYNVHPQARVFIGWRDITVEYDDPVVSEVEIQSGLNLGFTLTF